MSASKPRIRSFDDFREYSRWYLHDVGLTEPETLGHEFRIVRGSLKSGVIEFGDYAGRPKWKSPADLPEGEWNGRTCLQVLANLADIQGDTEFGSNELQVGLWDTAPSDYDRKILLWVMNEEFRHGWQMGWFATEILKCDEGFQAAQSLLERRAAQAGNRRLLGAFNEIIHDWIGFYSFLEFMDRDGGSQLSLLQHSAVAPLAESMVFMLREEAKHLRSGEQGYERILKAGKVPIEILQKYVNLYAPLGYDLHGGERSTNALIYWRLGLKGFYPSPSYTPETPASEVIDRQLFADLAHREREKAAYGYKFVNLGLEGPVGGINKELLNAVTVTFYKRALEGHFEKFNRLIERHYPAGTPRLVLPSIRFHRAEPSVYAGERYDIHGNRIESLREYEAYLAQNLPGERDRTRLAEAFEDPTWIAPPEQDVYKTPTAVKPGEQVLFPTTFGTKKPVRFTARLSSILPPSARAPDAPGPQPDEEPLWKWMDRQTGEADRGIGDWT